MLNFNQELQKNYNIGKVIVVADKGLNTGNNIAYNKARDLIGNVQKYNKKNSVGASKYVKHLVFDKTTGEIIDIYRGLWRIEETFKITKSELENRPIFVSRKDHIEAHFLTCYLALVLSRILEYKLDRKYSVGKILETLSNCNCSQLENNYYVFNYYNEILKDIGVVTNIDFLLKYRRLQDIKKILSETKNEFFRKNFRKQFTHLQFSYINCLKCVFSFFTVKVRLYLFRQHLNASKNNLLYFSY